MTAVERRLFSTAKETISPRPECFKAEGQPGFRGFGDIALAPEFGRQPPADLDGAGRQERQMIGSREADKADELAGGGDLGPPQSRSRRGRSRPATRPSWHPLDAVAAEREELHHPFVELIRW